MKGTFKKYDEKKEKLIILICLKWKVLMFSMLFNLWSRFLFSFLIRLDYYHHLYYLLFAMSQDELLFQLTRCHLIIHKVYQEKIWFFPSFALVIRYKCHQLLMTLQLLCIKVLKAAMFNKIKIELFYEINIYHLWKSPGPHGIVSHFAITQASCWHKIHFMSFGIGYSLRCCKEYSENRLSVR